MNADIGDSPGASFVDFDGDGDADLLVSNRDKPNLLYVNQEGVFTKTNISPLTSVSSYGSCWADYDNDGDLDAMLAGSPSFLVRNDGSGVFSLANSGLPSDSQGNTGWSCAWADYDLDGNVDLFIAHAFKSFGTPDQSNHLFHNMGNGSFERVTEGPIVTGAAPYTVGTWADFDADGDFDLFVGAGPADGTIGSDYHYRNLLTETGTATFERITETPFSLLGDGQVWNWIDYDNDGDLDVFRTNWNGGVGGLADQLFINDGGVFRSISSGTIVTEPGLSLASVWADFDNDADLDVFVVRDGYPTGGANRLFRNDLDGGFVSTTIGPVTRSWGGTSADYDGDGDIDLFLPTMYGASDMPPNVLYRNDLQNGNHWIKMRLKGTDSNRAGIGAYVVVESLKKGEEVIRQRRDVSSQNSFNGMNDLVVHVGLADASTADRITVVWPSGTVDELTNVTADQTIEIVEGSTGTATEPGPEHPGGMGSLDVWPNPSDGAIHISFGNEGGGFVTVRVIDILGREVRRVTPGAGVERVDLQLNALPTGVYMVRVESPGAERSRMVILR